jgi:hypothetical protein
MPRAEAGMLSGRVREVQIGRIGDVRANRMRGGRFPRVQCVGEPPSSTWREGRAISQHESRGTVQIELQNGSAHTGRYDRTVAPSAAKANVRTDATPSSSERAARDPTGDWKIAPSGPIYTICGGESPNRAVTTPGRQP